jgi:hypothetical protein
VNTDAPSTPNATPTPPEKPSLLRVLLGTAPGLERFLLAAAPAIVAAGLAIGVVQLPALVGVGIGFAVFAVVLIATRRAFP